jgi:hypothetical protein
MFIQYESIAKQTKVRVLVLVLNFGVLDVMS